MDLNHWTHALNIISKLTIFAALAFIILIGYWLTWPYEPIKFISEKTVLLNPDMRIKHGDPILIEVEVEQYEDGLPYTIDRRLVGQDMSYALPTTNRVTAEGYQKYVNATFTVPEFIPCGRYHIESVFKIQVNPLRTIIVRRESDSFEVYR
jgi:hypothetical protein